MFISHRSHLLIHSSLSSFSFGKLSFVSRTRLHSNSSRIRVLSRLQGKVTSRLVRRTGPHIALNLGASTILSWTAPITPSLSNRWSGTRPQPISTFPAHLVLSSKPTLQVMISIWCLLSLFPRYSHGRLLVWLPPVTRGNSCIAE